ncbi:MAG: hypothetical protein JO261_09530, partial [Alphaproteobacteria bacterium]|nr:hypothetical protein [Alphaproteobacteria bacterium]
GSQPGSTTVFGVNDRKEVSGSYTDSGGIQHGFFGHPDGSNYASFDYTDNLVDGTVARGLDNAGFITGFAPATNEGLLFGYEFLRKPNGTMITLGKGNANNFAPFDGIAQGISTNARSTGDYWDTVNFIRFGYTATRGKYKGDIVLPISTNRVAGRGIDKHGNTAGFFTAGGAIHGFFIIGGVFNQVDYPDASAIASYIEALNNQGMTAGQWADGTGNLQSFLLDTNTSTFTPITVPGATYVQVFGLSDKGLATVNSDVGAFIYCAFADPTKCPGGGTDVGQIKSIHVDPSSFLRYSAPAKTAVTSIRVKLKNAHMTQP